MGKSPVSLGKAFNRAEITAAVHVLLKDETGTQEITDMLMEGKHGALLDVDDEFITVLGLMSDDLAVRVGGLRGLTPEQSLEWAGGLLKEHGHPTTWEVEIVGDEEDEDEPSRDP
jgi:hypothetical protein